METPPNFLLIKDVRLICFPIRRHSSLPRLLGASICYAIALLVIRDLSLARINCRDLINGGLRGSESFSKSVQFEAMLGQPPTSRP